ncbi:MAG TPA: HlyD family efflux transporter periplasmic adaptor subunit [Candidatus Limiplasma sp.]|nr:HlyD family efflux transporter periplasmic adaptor subunit [Candidatus Limiplasma sp.]
MRNHRILILLAILLLAPLPALSSATFNGTVVSEGSMQVVALFDGQAESVSVLEGQRVSAGQPLVVLSTIKVYAPAGGTVSGVFAAPGDLLDETIAVTLETGSQYSVDATVHMAYPSPDMKYVKIGETVYIKRLSQPEYNAVGYVSAVDGTNYTVTTVSGSLYIGRFVFVYRKPDMTDASCIGRGFVGRAADWAIEGEGTLYKMHVTEGQQVVRGQLLYETVEGALPNAETIQPTVSAAVSGVVDTLNVSPGDIVARGDVLMTIVQPERYAVSFPMEENELGEIAVGQHVNITMDWEADTGRAFNGIVTQLSGIADADGQYTATVSFQADSSVRLGMSAVVQLQDTDQ